MLWYAMTFGWFPARLNWATSRSRKKKHTAQWIQKAALKLQWWFITSSQPESSPAETGPVDQRGQTGQDTVQSHWGSPLKGKSGLPYWRTDAVCTLWGGVESASNFISRSKKARFKLSLLSARSARGSCPGRGIQRADELWQDISSNPSIQHPTSIQTIVKS